MHGTAGLKLAKSSCPPLNIEIDNNMWIRQATVLAAAAMLIVILGANRSNAQQVLAPEASRPTEEKQQAVIAQLLRRKQEEGWRFEVGLTRVLAYKDAEITGAESGLPRLDFLQGRRALALQSMRLYERAKRKAGINDAGHDRRYCRPDAQAFSWRDYGKVTPPQDQVGTEACAACWAFAPIGAYESSYLIENNQRADMSPTPVNASEQMLVSCTPDSDCTIGYVTNAMDLLVWKGTTSRTTFAYFSHPMSCEGLGPFSALYRAVAWMPLSLNAHRVLSPERIKAALCTHGPVTTRLIVTEEFKAYTGGIYHQVGGHKLSVTDPGAHQVVIVGWDDSKGAWLIKNSWVARVDLPSSHQHWGLIKEGMAGYGWIEYGANLIGHHTNAIQAFHQGISPAALGKKYVQLKSKYFDPKTVHCSCYAPDMP